MTTPEAAARVFLLVATLGGCGSVCERAADYRFDCGEPGTPPPADECGRRTEAACRAECVLAADCLVFEDRAQIDPAKLSELTTANTAYEACLADCRPDDTGG